MAFLTCNAVKCLLLLLVLCMLQAERTSGCDNFGRGCYNQGPAESALMLHNRKVTAGAYVEGGRKTLEEIFKDNTGREHGRSPVLKNNGHGGNIVDWELRKVPSGPDPLHHHGGTPNKPQTP